MALAREEAERAYKLSKDARRFLRAVFLGPILENLLFLGCYTFFSTSLHQRSLKDLQTWEENRFKIVELEVAPPCQFR